MLWCLVCRLLQSQSGRYCSGRCALCGNDHHTRWSRRGAAETTESQWRRGGTTAMPMVQPMSEEGSRERMNAPPFPKREQCGFRRDASSRNAPETRDQCKKAWLMIPSNPLLSLHGTTRWMQAIAVGADTHFCVSRSSVHTSWSNVYGHNYYCPFQAGNVYCA
jgi:hypothetical protein